MSVRFALHAGLVVAAMFVFACGPVPSAPEGAVEFEPPGIYRRWYREAEACRGLPGDYEILRFYRVPDANNHLELGVRGAIGRWTRPHRIYVLEGYDLDEPTLKHEMLHDLLSYVGDFTHDDSLAFRVCDLTDERRL
ncbi:MAG TPA: hypothetical protein VJP59_03995 [Gemmatimonadota bacterium]|nr:hypothetical protein [Gemmatimonadota bacterium]